MMMRPMRSSVRNDRFGDAGFLTGGWCLRAAVFWQDFAVCSDLRGKKRTLRNVLFLMVSCPVSEFFFSLGTIFWGGAVGMLLSPS